MTDELFLKNLWRWKCDLPEEDYTPKRMPSLEILKEIQWSNRFERLMRNRMIMGSFRYGMIPDQRHHFNYDNMGSIHKRADLYEQTGNTELLVDIANLSLVEFEVGRHPNKHFSATDDGKHVRLK